MALKEDPYVNLEETAKRTWVRKNVKNAWSKIRKAESDRMSRHRRMRKRKEMRVADRHALEDVGIIDVSRKEDPYVNLEETAKFFFNLCFFYYLFHATIVK
jgi:hypothetical protein